MKTFLIGLGGLGCKAVSRVYNLIDHSIISAACIDSDWHDLEELKEIGMPSFYLGINRVLNTDDLPGCENWIPDNNALLLAHHMGQYRAVGRLLFELYIKDDSNAFFEYISQQLIYTHQELIRVVVVTSLAGGFGSGSVIPFSILLRYYFQRFFGMEIDLTGIFVSPEYFIKSFPDLSANNIIAMHANAYATLKELYTINEINRSGALPNRAFLIDTLFENKRDLRNFDRKAFDEILFVNIIKTYGSGERTIDEISNTVFGVISTPYLDHEKINFYPYECVGSSRLDYCMYEDAYKQRMQEYNMGCWSSCPHIDKRWCDKGRLLSLESE